uniref:Uncharacterized protein n=1 Tax=Caenorhabditis japonica TaxID=281687 RepID=A0A8R1HTZ1_CAEJA
MYDEQEISKTDSEYKCYLNPLFSQMDLGDISLASLAVISIILCIAVLMVVCVVDDELAPRMKPNAAGEPSKFSYVYGPPFFSSALSFIPVQICACLHAFLYFRRYPSVVEKLKFVPGLEAKLRRAQLDKELGIPPLENFRRGSLASYLPILNFSQGSRRNSRRSSQASFSNPSLLFMQDV